MGSQTLPLRDIHLPDAIGWWPPAMGWWMLAVLIPLICWFFIWFYKRMTRKTALKTAKKYFLSIRQDKKLDDKETLDALSELIRRVAISTSVRSETASLTGHDWLVFLDSSMQGSPFTEGVGQCFADAHYQKNVAHDLSMPQLLKLCEDWLNVQKENKK